MFLPATLQIVAGLLTGCIMCLISTVPPNFATSQIQDLVAMAQKQEVVHPILTMFQSYDTDDKQNRRWSEGRRSCKASGRGQVASARDVLCYWCCHWPSLLCGTLMRTILFADASTYTNNLPDAYPKARRLSNIRLKACMKASLPPFGIGSLGSWRACGF